MSSTITTETPALTAEDPSAWSSPVPGQERPPSSQPVAVRATEAGQAPILIGGRAYHPRQIAACAFVIAGLVAIALGWYGTSGSRDVWQEVPYMVSGGIFGAALIAIGIVVYLSYEHLEDRRFVQQLIQRLDGLELGLAGEFDAVAERLDGLGRRSTAGPKQGSR